MANNKHEYCGECVFCNSICPECGSKKVNIEWIIKYTYNNIDEDIIKARHKESNIRLDCKYCGCYICLDEGETEELYKLERALSSSIELPDIIKYTYSDGNVKTMTGFIE